MAKKITDLKPAIVQSLSLFHDSNTTNAISNFYETLGYSSELNYELDNVTPHDFILMINSDGGNDKRLLLEEWQSVDYLFQLTEEQIKNVADIPEFNINYINSYLFLTITLKNDYYSRTQLSSITREINRLSAIPIMLTFKHGSSLTIAIIDRRPNQKDTDKDVLQKITLIKDINLVNTHRAHLEILNDFALSNIIKRDKLESFDDLHKAWYQVLSTSELNKKFYREISNWYFWAVKTVQFPLSDDEKTNNPTNIIRLITRLIFVWFLKEKGLINPELFKLNSVHQLLVSLDDEESSYYKAILQNLFFGTLNRPMGENNRSFDGGYFYGQYFQDNEQFLELCRDIPFLNGGLFECLDKEDKVVDGFSEAGDNPLDVPNKLFFGQPEEMDLSEVYGKKRKKEYIRGIVHIFNDYKFTIDENTSIDEEIALDPELLGKVFENLLAEYNPETETTARKQTGSFYTPREIVNYMVDESVIAYLKQQVMDKLGGDGEQLESQLRELLSFSEVNPFVDYPDVVRVLITAIDNMKILDPACGSGAFPMGILQKLVHILSKLDPDNQRWREQQRDRAIAPLQEDIKQAQKISYEEAREQAIAQLENRLKQIEDEFDNNEQDYPRKLFLIENCIYGVDIQPIAVQISKLRFFISLIVEQKVNETLDNRGILPLPNLETKFVCANTLIGIDKPEQSQLELDLRDKEIKEKEKELLEVRKRHFQATTHEVKEQCRKDDKKLRERIGELLTYQGLPDEIAQKLSKWNPYDQNSSSDFFDSEWMFGVNGFDIIIGNPPYVQMQKDGGYLAKLYQNQSYFTFERTGDIYALFYEMGLNILKEKGNLTYITSNKWMRSKYGESLRSFFLKYNPIKLIDLGANVFESATVDTNIILISREKNKNNCLGLTLNRYININLEINNWTLLTNLTKDSWAVLTPTEINIKRKIEENGKPLKDWNFKINYGIKTGFNEAFIIDNETKEELCRKDLKSTEIIKPVIRGKDIKKYQAYWAGFWLITTHNGYTKNNNYIPSININNYHSIKNHLNQYLSQITKRQDQGDTPYNLRNCAYMKEFEKETVCWQRITQANTFSLLTNKEMILDSMAFLSDIDDYKHILLAVLNSKLIYFYISLFVHEYGNTGFRLSNQYVEKIPIPEVDKMIQKPFIEIVDKILKDKELGKNTSVLEHQIDVMVYHLYNLSYEEASVIDPKLNKLDFENYNV